MPGGGKVGFLWCPSWQGKLPSGRYRFYARLECQDEATVTVLERPLVLEEDDVTLPLSVTATCGCAL